MESQSPSTPDNQNRFTHPGVRRVHTLPSKLISPSSRTSPNVSPAQDSVETLFVHPGTKVVSFNVQGSGNVRPGSSSGRRHDQDAGSSSGTLAWDSPSERTMAAGPLRIYRVPSSGVSFLNSGSLLHPILQRSQCWCVDEQSKFVLRVREGNFYRIELPITNEEEKSKVEEFKTVLDTVLQFEKTPSPFRRGYMEESERPQTPVRRVSQIQPKAKKWRLNKVWEPEDPEQRAKWSPANKEERLKSPGLKRRPAADLDGTGSGPSDESAEDEDTITEGSVKEEDEEPETPEENDQLLPAVHGSGSPKTFKLPIRLRPMQRSVTAPPPLTFEASSPSSPAPLSRTESRDTDTASIASSHDTFYSTDEQPTIEPENPGEPSSMATPSFPPLKSRFHSRQISELTIVPDTPTPLPTHSNAFAREPSPVTPTLISDTDSNSSDHDPPFQDAPTPPDTLRLRRLPRRLSSISATSSTIALEPLRSPKIFSTPREPNKAQLLSAALVQKAYSLLISPPVHLIQVMLEIAARIVRGVRWDGPLVLGDRGDRVPGGWVDEDEWSDGEEEDDFGIPLGNLRRGSDVSARSGRSSRSSVD